jgi:hypothetical protein
MFIKSGAFNFEYWPAGYDETKPLIYVWTVGKELYVGRSKNGAGRPLRHYRRNVNRLLSGCSYRKRNPDGWRRVHIAMAEVVRNEAILKLEIVANAEADQDIHELERKWIKKLQPTLNG